MSHAHLIACPGCSRHARADDPKCPFCGGDLGDAARASAPRAAPAQRLSRAALYAFGVGSLAVVTSCGGTVSGASDGKDTREDASQVEGGSHPDSDVTGPVDAQHPRDAEGSRDVGNVAVPYGVPPEFDAEAVDAGEGPADAARGFDAACCPPYGLPGR